MGRARQGNNDISRRILDFKVKGNRGVGRPKNIRGWIVWWKIWGSRDGGGCQGWTFLLEGARGSRGSLLMLLLLLMKYYDSPHYTVFYCLLSPFFRNGTLQTKKSSLWTVTANFHSVCSSSWVRQTSHTWSSSWTVESIARLNTNKLSSSWSKLSSGTQAGSGLKAVDLLRSTRSKRNWLLRNRTGQCYLVSPAGRKLTFVRKKNLLNGLKIYICDSSVVGVWARSIEVGLDRIDVGVFGL